MSAALGSRQRLLLQQRTVQRRFIGSSGKAAQPVWIRPTPFRISIHCKAGEEPTVTPSAPPAVPSAPPAAYPQYAQPAPVAGEYVLQAEQPGLAPPARPQEYYVAPPPPPMYPAPVYREAQSSSGLPWFIWVGVGILVTTAFQKISEVVKKGPQQMMAEMAMKQMMSAMQQQQGGGAASPFGAGAPGAPFGAAGANPYAANPFAGFTPPPTSAPVDTTATPSTTAAAAAPPSTPTPPPASASPSRGEKFSQRISQEGRTEDAATTPLDVVEPVVKEPPPMGTATTSSSPPKAAFFQDVDTTSTPPSTPPPAADASAGFASAGAGSSSGGGGGGGDSAVAVMMEKMLRNPDMQKMLYPYLPEPMRNPESIEWMLNNPEVKAQMEKMLADQGFNMPPQMVEMMKNMDLSEDKVNQQFQQLGIKPEDVMQKIMANPEIANGFTNPRVQQAIMDISSNPMNIVNYQNDAEVMKVLSKINEIFAPGMAGMPGMGGMPPGMPMRPPGA